MSGLRLLNAGPSERGWHRLQDALRCPQLFAYHHVLGLSGNRAVLVRGSLGHIGLAHHYTRMRDQQAGRQSDVAPVPDAMAALAKEFGQLGQEMLPVASAAVETYLERFRTERIRVEMVEEQVKATVACDPIAPGRSFLFTQRLDLAFRDRSGRVWISDHKFVARPTRGTAERYTLSGQFLGFQWFGQRLWGREFGGVLVNLVGCTPPYHVERARLAAAPGMLARLPQIVVDAELVIERLRDRDPWQYPCAANEITCAQVYGDRCEFWDLCQWGKPEHSARVASLE